jgi:homoserine O-acetyltransferase
MARILSAIVLLFSSVTASAQPAQFPAPVDGDFIARDFTFTSGERLPEVKIHYRTIGAPRKDADGVVRNGVLILHGTGGTGAGLSGRELRGTVVRQGATPRRGEALHHPAGQHRARPVEQAE